MTDRDRARMPPDDPAFPAIGSTASSLSGLAGPPSDGGPRAGRAGARCGEIADGRARTRAPGRRPARPGVRSSRTSVPPGASIPTSSPCSFEPRRRRAKSRSNGASAAAARASRRGARARSGRRAKSSAAAAARASSSSTVKNGTPGASAGDDPRRADAAARADLGHPRAAALRREDVEQPARLRAARAVEAQPRGQRERALDERRDHVPRLSRVPEPLPLPPHFDAGRIGEVWRVDYAARFEDAARWRVEHGLSRRRARSLPHRARRRRRPEHVLHAGLRALRRRPLRHGRARRLAPPLRVRLPQPRLDHAGLPDARHASARSRSSTRSCSSTRTGEHPEPVHARDGRRRRDGSLADRSGRRRGPRARPRVRGGAPALLHRAARARAASTTSPSGRSTRMRGGIGYALVSAVEEALFFHAIARRVAGRLPAEGRQPAHRALLDARARGRGRPGRRAARPRATSR